MPMEIKKTSNHQSHGLFDCRIKSHPVREFIGEYRVAKSGAKPVQSREKVPKSSSSIILGELV